MCCAGSSVEVVAGKVMVVGGHHVVWRMGSSRGGGLVLHEVLHVVVVLVRVQHVGMWHSERVRTT